jgi:hypothetical protein
VNVLFKNTEITADHLEFVEPLLSYDADVSLPNKEGVTPLQLADTEDKMNALLSPVNPSNLKRWREPTNTLQLVKKIKRQNTKDCTSEIHETQEKEHK